MGNIKFSFMNHFKTIPYKKIPNFRNFYYEDKTNIAYYLDWDRVLRYVKATGYDGIEVAPWDLVEMMSLFGTPENFKDFAAERGISISGMFHGMSNAHDRSAHKAVFEHSKRMIDVVKGFGGEHLNFCPGSNYYGIGPLDEEGIQSTIDIINEVGRYAIDQGVKIGIHNEFFCVMNLPNHRRIIEATDPKAVFYCLDTAQVSIIGEDLVKFYDDYHDRICTFHLKDTADPKTPDSVRYGRDVEIQDDGHRWFWEPGEGVLDFPALWELLKKYQFKGWMTIETDGTPDLLASMALSSYYVNQVLGKIYR